MTDSEIRALKGASLSNGVAMPGNMFMWLVSSNKTVLTEPLGARRANSISAAFFGRTVVSFLPFISRKGGGELDMRLNGRASSFLGDQDAHAGCGAQFHVTMGLRSVGQRVAVGNRDFYVTAGDDIDQVAGAGEHFFAIAQMP